LCGLLVVNVLVSVGAIPARASATPVSTSVARRVVVQLSSPAARASAVDYGLTFVTSAKLASDGTITVAAPGTVMPSCVVVVDQGASNSTRTVIGTEFDACAEAGTGLGTAFGESTKTYQSSGAAIPISHRVLVEVDGVTNPDQPGTHDLTVKTSGGEPASGAYKVVAAKAISDPFVQTLPPIAGATAVTSTVSFDTSPIGGLADHGSITLSLAGASLPSCAQVTDLGRVRGAGAVISGDEEPVMPGASSATGVHTFDACVAGVPTKAGQSWTYVFSGTGIPAGHMVHVELQGMTNPVAAGKHVLTVRTSSDGPGTASLQLLKPQDVTHVELKTSTSAAGARDVEYDVTFAMSSHGYLPSDGTITVSALGAGLPQCVRWMDLGPAAGISGTPRSTSPTQERTFDACASGTAGLEGSRTYVSSGTPILAGHRVGVELEGVTNPLRPGDLELTVRTSSDGPGRTTFKVVPADKVSEVRIMHSSSAPGARSVRYTVSFRTSPLGALAADGTITVLAPGTRLPTCGRVSDVRGAGTGDLGLDGALGTPAREFDVCAPGDARPGPSMTYQSSGWAIPADQLLELALTAVTNPSTSGQHQLTVRTSSDGPGSASYNIGTGAVTP
jgi:hypothetical protein